MRVVLYSLFMCSVAAAAAHSATIHVPADEPTIQAGIDAASPGDIVEVACGTYYESFIVMKSGVVLRSATGQPDCVIVDAERNDRVFHCQGMNANTRVEGFTIQNGLRTESGGMWCVFSSMTIERCRFLNNETEHDAAGLGLYGASPVIRECEFVGNHTSGAGGSRDHNRGGAIYMFQDCSPTISACRFEDNASFRGGAIWCSTVSTPTISGCTFVRNSAIVGGGAAFEDGSTFSLEDCLFVGNDAEEGGGVYVNAAAGDIAGCTFAGNLAMTGGQVFATGGSHVDVDGTIVAFGLGGGSVATLLPAAATLSCTDIFGNIGGDWVGNIAGQEGLAANFSADPLFCDASADLYTLSEISPCAPPGLTGCGLIGSEPVGCGSVSIQPTSWAMIKAGFR